MPRGRGRGQSRSDIQRQINAAIRRSNRHDNGQHFVPSLLPPQFVKVPWNSFTFSASYTGGSPIHVKSSTLRDYVRGLVATSNISVISIKVEKARVWNIAVGGSSGFKMPNLSSSFYELTLNHSNIQNVRSTQSDHGTLDLPARTGYVWPISDRTEVLSNTEDINLLTTYGVQGSTVVVMVNFLWRSVPKLSEDDPLSPFSYAGIQHPP